MEVEGSAESVVVATGTAEIWRVRPFCRFAGSPKITGSTAGLYLLLPLNGIGYGEILRKVICNYFLAELQTKWRGPRGLLFFSHYVELT